MCAYINLASESAYFLSRMVHPIVDLPKRLFNGTIDIDRLMSICVRSSTLCKSGGISRNNS